MSGGQGERSPVIDGIQVVIEVGFPRKYSVLNICFGKDDSS